MFAGMKYFELGGAKKTVIPPGRARRMNRVHVGADSVFIKAKVCCSCKGKGKACYNFLFRLYKL